MRTALRVFLWLAVVIAVNAFLYEISKASGTYGFICGVISGLTATGLLSLLE